MEDYKTMYAILCAAASEGIDLLEEKRVEETIDLLEKALLQAEELYLC